MGGSPDADDPTGVAPTELGDAIAETEANTAWSLDDGEEWPPPRRLTPSRITAMAVAASLVLLAGTVVLAVHHLRKPTTGDVTQAQRPPSALTPARSSWDVGTTGFPIPPAPVETVTVERPPPPPSSWLTPSAWNAADDQRFVENLKARGWNVWNPAQVTGHAHTVCESLQNGDTVPSINQQLVTAGLLYPPEAASFTETAMNSYPNCP